MTGGRWSNLNKFQRCRRPHLFVKKDSKDTGQHWCPALTDLLVDLLAGLKNSSQISSIQLPFLPLGIWFVTPRVKTLQREPKKSLQDMGMQSFGLKTIKIQKTLIYITKGNKKSYKDLEILQRSKTLKLQQKHQKITWKKKTFNSKKEQDLKNVKPKNLKSNKPSKTYQPWKL